MTSGMLVIGYMVWRYHRLTIAVPALNYIMGISSFNFTHWGFLHIGACYGPYM